MPKQDVGSGIAVRGGCGGHFTTPLADAIFHSPPANPDGSPPAERGVDLLRRSMRTSRLVPTRTPLLLLASLTLLGGCASAGHLAEYDFPGATLSVVTTAPPHPDVLTDDEWDIDESSLLGAFMSVGTRVAREVSAEKARQRLDSATAAVDVSGRMADRVHEGANRILRTRAVAADVDPDFELEVRIEEYGIEADDLDAAAAFRVRARVFLRDGATGREIWKADVDEEEPIRHSAWGSGPGSSANNVATAAALQSLSVREMEEALRSLADFAADRIVDRLRRGYGKAEG